ncbi:nonstructural protein, putative serine protase [Avastrovirus 1]|uniref:Non-structural polyprotein 1A n=1 Tax=Turkey astrovirus 1 TaxID=364370 RepID=NS1A_TASV1|nr:orf1a polyprotein (pp1a) [Turkey astrovirus]Q9JH70.1 RecName: Full=Non-structural polyprotein 1A; Contains: RecName: Full=VPg; Contains: RecName: Full=Protein p19; Contains: RecName: Full=Transmembrane protein 1A; Contains: RecName: Full=Serine protease p27; Short=p27; Contains: RecName: Full=Protein p20' [Turkey astrovirus 1]CAB95005.1 nonstructural protein, putative serine protase [Avastrovirus 1]
MAAAAASALGASAPKALAPADGPIVAGLDKLVNLEGVHDLFEAMRGAYGEDPAWKGLMSCDVVYLKDITTAIGVKDTSVGIFRKFSDGCSWCPTGAECFLSMKDLAYMKAQSAKAQRLTASLATTSNLIARAMRAESELKRARDEERKVDARYKDILEHSLAARKALQKELDETRERELHLLKELGKRSSIRTKAFSFFDWLFMAVVFFLFLHYTSAECVKPDFGCLVVNSNLPVPSLTFHDVMARCYNTFGNIVLSSQIDAARLREECEQSANKFLGTHIGDPAHKVWCENRLETLIPVECDSSEFLEIFTSNLNAFMVSVSQFYKTISYYKLDALVTFAFSAALATNKLKMVMVLPLLLVALYLNVPPITVTIASVIFQPLILPFVGFQLVFPNFLPYNLFVAWVWMVCQAFFSSDGVKLLVSVSTALVQVVFLAVWSISVIVLQQLSIPMVAQILLFVATLTVSVGVKFANSTITVVHPDGNTEKVSRVTLVRQSMAKRISQIKQSLTIRGVIPSGPNRFDSIVVVEGQGGSGVGWRFMNSIFTAGHVVQGSKFVTIKSESTQVKVKVKRVIDLFECVDTLVEIPLTKEFQHIKPLRLAKKVEDSYLQLCAFKPDMVEKASYQGWCTIDSGFIFNSFNTQFGNSGAPYVDSDGRLVGMHLGSQGVISQGVVLVDTLKTQFLAQQSQIDDQLMERIIEGTKVSHAAILTELDRMRTKVEEVALVSARVNQLESQLKDLYEFSSNSIKCLSDDIEKMVCAQLFDEINLQSVMEKISALPPTEKLAKLVEVFVEQKKKGKTKRTARGGKHALGKKYLSKAHFSRMRMLTEEEYNKMVEDGFSPDEIKEVVDQLREQAWQNYLIDNDIGEDDDLDWYDDMLEDERLNEEIDRRVEAALEDRGELAYQKIRRTFVDQALIHLITLKKGNWQTTKVECQPEREEAYKEQFQKAVKQEDLTEGTSYAIYSAGDATILIENKEIDHTEIKPVTTGAKTVQEYPKDARTTVATFDDNKKDIVKTKRTTEIVLEQRKKTCRTCGETRPHNHKMCRDRHTRRFCFWCGVVHSDVEGHSRDLKCPKCSAGFANLREMEQHAVTTCSKN